MGMETNILPLLWTKAIQIHIFDIGECCWQEIKLLFQGYTNYHWVVSNKKNKEIHLYQNECSNLCYVQHGLRPKQNVVHLQLHGGQFPFQFFMFTQLKQEKWHKLIRLFSRFVKIKFLPYPVDVFAPSEKLLGGRQVISLL